METVIDPLEYATELEFNRDTQVAVGKKWKDCKFPSMEVLKNWNGHGYLVWPEEGKFDSKGNFQFFEKFSEPLLVDRNSASLVLQLANASPGAMAMLTGKAMEERAWFVAVAKTAWGHATFGR